MYVAVFCLPWKQNKGTLSGAGSIKQLPQFLKDKGFKSILVVTDNFLFEHGMADPIAQEC